MLCLYTVYFHCLDDMLVHSALENSNSNSLNLIDSVVVVAAGAVVPAAVVVVGQMNWNQLMVHLEEWLLMDVV